MQSGGIITNSNSAQNVSALNEGRAAFNMAPPQAGDRTSALYTDDCEARYFMVPA